MTRKKPKTTFSWQSPKIKVREMEKYGEGIFAKKRKAEILIKNKK